MSFPETAGPKPQTKGWGLVMSQRQGKQRLSKRSEVMLDQLTVAMGGGYYYYNHIILFYYSM